MQSTPESDALICRDQMITIAWKLNLRVARSTIHRWANEPGFPLAVGLDGRKPLYLKSEYIAYIQQRLKKIQENH